MPKADFIAGVKECSQCHIVQSVSEFTKNKNTSDGLMSACKTCASERSRNYYEAHRQERIDYAVQWNRENAELRKQYNDTWLAANLEEQKQRRSDAAKIKYWSDPERWRAYHRDAVWKNHLLRNFQMTVEDYLELLMLQNYACAMCGEECASGKRLAVDHDHDCCDQMPTCGRCVRGLLCISCNGGIGFLKDDVELLVTAITYIQFHKDRLELPE